MFSNPQTRRATRLGLVLVGLTLCCCLVTVGGWVLGGFDALRGGNLDQVARSGVSAPVDGAITLEVTHGVGNVTVRGDGENEVRVEVVARGATLEVAQAVTATLAAEGQELTLTLQGVDEDEVQVDLVIHTPPETALLLATRVGAVEVVGLRGALEIEHASGRVVVQDHAADERFIVRGGSTNVSVSLESVEPGTSIALSSRVGGVDIRLPDSIGFQLDASSDAGRVEAGGFTFNNRTDEQDGPANAVKGVADPADGRTVTLEAGVGDIFLGAR